MSSPYEFMIPYPLVVAEGETADALNYSVSSSWTRLYVLPGHTGFTAHFIQLAALAKRLPISSACFRLVFQSGDSGQLSAKIISLCYVNGVAVWDTDWGTFQRRSAYNPDNQGVDITTKLRSFLSNGAANPQLSLEVLGSGVIHEATLEVVYAVPDYAEVIEALSLRLDALESSPQPAALFQTIEVPPAGTSLRFVQQVVS